MSVHRYSHNFPTPLVLALLLAAASLLLCSFLKCFFGLVCNCKFKISHLAELDVVTL